RSTQPLGSISNVANIHLGGQRVGSPCVDRDVPFYCGGERWRSEGPDDNARLDGAVSSACVLCVELHIVDRRTDSEDRRCRCKRPDSAVCLRVLPERNRGGHCRGIGALLHGPLVLDVSPNDVRCRLTSLVNAALFVPLLRISHESGTTLQIHGHARRVVSPIYHTQGGGR